MSFRIHSRLIFLTMWNILITFPNWDVPNYVHDRFRMVPEGTVFYQSVDLTLESHI